MRAQGRCHRRSLPLISPSLLKQAAQMPPPAKRRRRGREQMRGRELMVLAVAIAGDAAESDIGRKSPWSQIEQPFDPATGLWL